jgi:hypothetical protein
MITNHLEKLVLSGHASFNTFVAGGAEKNVLNIQSDRFIIITDITIFPPGGQKHILNDSELQALIVKDSLFQMKVKSDKSENTFVVRSNFQVARGHNNNEHIVTGGNPVKLDTYLIHTNDVAFIFSYGDELKSSLDAVTDALGVGFRPRADYGKDGYSESQSIRQVSELATTPPGNFIINGGNHYFDLLPTDVRATREFIFPIIPALKPKTDQINRTQGTPLAIIQYVEILGNPTNISATL